MHTTYGKTLRISQSPANEDNLPNIASTTTATTHRQLNNQFPAACRCMRCSGRACPCGVCVVCVSWAKGTATGMLVGEDELGAVELFTGSETLDASTSPMLDLDD